MARKSLREPRIDTELAYAYAKTDRLHDMEEFLALTNVADILSVGEKCFEDELYQASKLLFSSINNWARLATTLIYLGETQAAVESARKAGNTQVWKQVQFACLEKKEFRLAQICGLNIIVHAEELPVLLKEYEKRGYFDEVVSLLEAGLSLERAHMGIFTELAILYSKYRPEKRAYTHPTVLLVADTFVQSWSTSSSLLHASTSRKRSRRQKRPTFGLSWSTCTSSTTSL